MIFEIFRTQKSFVENHLGQSSRKKSAWQFLVKKDAAVKLFLVI